MNLLNSMAKSLFIPVTLILLLSGCGNTYTFNNKVYGTPEDALAAHKEFLVDVQNELKPYETPSAGKAVIITPSKKTCAALGVTRKGQPAQELVDYIGQDLSLDYAFFSNFLRTSNLFTTVDSIVVDYPLQAVNKVKNDYDVIIYLNIQSPTQIGWFLITPQDNKPRAINMDNLAKNGAPKIQSWLDATKEHIEGRK